MTLLHTTSEMAVLWQYNLTDFIVTSAVLVDITWILQLPSLLSTVIAYLQ